MSSLAHHGVKGQKWGVRRYQNPDGTRTALGKKQASETRLRSRLLKYGRSKINDDASYVYRSADLAKRNPNIRVKDSNTDIIKKNTTLNRLTDTDEKLDDRLKYLSFTDNDLDWYKEHLEGKYMLDVYKAARDLEIANGHAVVNYISQIETESDPKKGKLYAEAIQKQFDDEAINEAYSDWRVGVLPVKDTELLKKIHNDSVKRLTIVKDIQRAYDHSEGYNKLAEQLSDRIKDAGYDGYADLNDSGYNRYGAEYPLVVLNPKGKLERKKHIQYSSIGGNMNYIYGNTLVLGDSSYLAHHGVKGQKWGVRRYQNPDGTRTALGKKHYSVEAADVESTRKDIKNIVKKFSKKDKEMFFDRHFWNESYDKTDAQVAKRFVIKEGRDIVAFIDAQTSRYDSDLNMVIGTTQCARGKGYASILSKKMVDWYESEGYKDYGQLEWNAYNENVGSRKAAEKAGFKQVSGDYEESNYLYDKKAKKELNKLSSAFNKKKAVESEVEERINSDFEKTLMGKFSPITRFHAYGRTYWDIDNPHYNSQGRTKANLIDSYAEYWAKKKHGQDIKAYTETANDFTRAYAEYNKKRNKVKHSSNAKPIQKELKHAKKEQRAYDDASKRVFDAVDKADQALQDRFKETDLGKKNPKAIPHIDGYTTGDISSLFSKSTEKQIYDWIRKQDDLREPIREAEEIRSKAESKLRKKVEHTSIGGNMNYIYGNTLILGDTSYLEHHGIKNQKWGVRRFQNPDGSLTAAGRIRYGVTGAAKAAFKVGKKLGSATASAAKAGVKKAKENAYAKKKEKVSQTREGVLKNKKMFTNEELERLEKRFKIEDDMRNAGLRHGQEIAKTISAYSDAAVKTMNALQTGGKAVKAISDGLSALQDYKEKRDIGKKASDAGMSTADYKEYTKAKTSEKTSNKPPNDDNPPNDGGGGGLGAKKAAATNGPKEQTKYDYSRRQAQDELNAKRKADLDKQEEDIKAHQDALVKVSKQRQSEQDARDEDLNRRDKAASEREERLESAAKGAVEVFNKLNERKANLDRREADLNKIADALDSEIGYRIDTLSELRKTSQDNNDDDNPKKKKNVKQSAIGEEMYVDYLEHFGLKGMKWGVRRFQNKDGSLTDAGKKRYSNTGELDGGGGGGAPEEEDEETKKAIEEAAKKAGMTVDEYRKKFADKVAALKEKARDAAWDARYAAEDAADAVTGKASKQIAEKSAKSAEENERKAKAARKEGRDEDAAKYEERAKQSREISEYRQEKYEKSLAGRFEATSRKIGAKAQEAKDKLKAREPNRSIVANGSASMRSAMKKASDTADMYSKYYGAKAKARKIAENSSAEQRAKYGDERNIREQVTADELNNLRAKERREAATRSRMTRKFEKKAASARAHGNVDKAEAYSRESNNQFSKAVSAYSKAEAFRDARDTTVANHVVRNAKTAMKARSATLSENRNRNAAHLAERRREKAINEAKAKIRSGKLPTSELTRYAKSTVGQLKSEAKAELARRARETALASMGSDYARATARVTTTSSTTNTTDAHNEKLARDRRDKRKQAARASATAKKNRLAGSGRKKYTSGQTSSIGRVGSGRGKTSTRR